MHPWLFLFKNRKKDVAKDTAVICEIAPYIILLPSMIHWIGIRVSGSSSTVAYPFTSWVDCILRGTRHAGTSEDIVAVQGPAVCSADLWPHLPCLTACSSVRPCGCQLKMAIFYLASSSSFCDTSKVASRVAGHANGINFPGAPPPSCDHL